MDGFTCRYRYKYMYSLTGILLFHFFFHLCLMSHWYLFSMFKCVKDKPEGPEGEGKKPSHQTKVI